MQVISNRASTCGSTCDVYHSSDLIGYYQEEVEKIPRKLFSKKKNYQEIVTLRDL